MVAAGSVSAGTPLGLIVAIALLSGVARSVGFTAYTTLGFSEVPEEDMAHANGLSATTQQLAAALGVALATVALRLGGAVGRLFSGAPRHGYQLHGCLCGAWSGRVGGDGRRQPAEPRCGQRGAKGGREAGDRPSAENALTSVNRGPGARRARLEMGPLALPRAIGPPYGRY